MAKIGRAWRFSDKSLIILHNKKFYIFSNSLCKKYLKQEAEIGLEAGLRVEADITHQYIYSEVCVRVCVPLKF